MLKLMQLSSELTKVPSTNKKDWLEMFLESAESLKAVATAASGRGTFWTSGEHFGQKFSQFG